MPGTPLRVVGAVPDKSSEFSNLGLDDALFLTDFKFAKLSGLPLFYKSVIRAWPFLNVKKVRALTLCFGC